jgi:hypothetical protein
MVHLSPSTLGHLQDDDYRLAFYCEEVLCRRTLDLDLAKAIELWGRDLEYAGHRWKARCAVCGSKNIGVRLTPGPYKEQLRRAAETQKARPIPKDRAG